MLYLVILGNPLKGFRTVNRALGSLDFLRLSIMGTSSSPSEYSEGDYKTQVLEKWGWLRGKGKEWPPSLSVVAP